MLQRVWHEEDWLQGNTQSPWQPEAHPPPWGSPAPQSEMPGLVGELAAIVEQQVMPAPVTLDSVLDALASIRVAIKAQVPLGYLHSETYNLTNTTPVSVYFRDPLFTLKITNDGPGNLQYRIPDNGSQTWTVLNSGETDSHNFVEGLIGSLGLQLLTGASASVRLRGLF